MDNRLRPNWWFIGAVVFCAQFWIITAIVVTNLIHKQ